VGGAVADAAGGDWPRRAREAAKAIVKRSKESTPSLGIRLLSDLRNVFGVFEGIAGAEKLTTAAILFKLHQIDEAPWGDMRGSKLTDIGLAKRLSAYDIKPKTIRIGIGSRDVAKGYKQADFYEAWKRYLPSPGPKPVTPVAPVMEGQEPQE